MSRLRSVFFGVLHASGLPFLLRHTVQRNRITILMFHNPSPRRAKGYLGALAKRYNIISLDTCVDALTGGFDRLPARPLIVTFDDGFAGNRQLLALFEKYNLRPTLFLCSGIAGTRRRFWWTVPMDRATEERLKVVPDDERLATLATFGYTDVDERPEAAALSATEIAELRGVVDFGSHSISHPVLPRCSDEKAQREITDSKRSLEEQFGLSIRAFAYPNGDATPREEQFVKRAGYACALTTRQGFVGHTADPFRLPRFGMNDEGSVSETIVSASGLWAALHGVLKTMIPRAGRA